MPDDVPQATRRWLRETWPFVRRHLPDPPARVLEIGCGPAGGFVPALLAEGFDAVGIDPEAPPGPAYVAATFEAHRPAMAVEAVIACTSLHHVADLDDVLDRVAASLVPGGTFVVIEWAYERFDEPTAQWCFDRLAATDEPGWLHGHRDGWAASGEPWDDYRARWASTEGLHQGSKIVRAVENRLRTRLTDGPYFFSDLGGVTSGDEQAAIDSGEIRATGLRLVSVLDRSGTGRATP